MAAGLLDRGRPGRAQVLGVAVLADSQLALVLAAARRVPKLWRSRWLAAVADYLTGRELDDAAVRAALDYADEKIL